MKTSEFFEGLSEKEVKDILLNYMEDLFVDQNKLILTPKKVIYLKNFVIHHSQNVNAMYFILLGTVKVYDNTPESLNFMKKTLLFNDKNVNNYASLSDSKILEEFDENQDLQCVDDNILKEFKEEILNDKDKNLLFKNVQDLEYGESFGCKYYNNNNNFSL